MLFVNPRGQSDHVSLSQWRRFRHYLLVRRVIWKLRSRRGRWPSASPSASASDYTTATAGPADAPSLSAPSLRLDSSSLLLPLPSSLAGRIQASLRERLQSREGAEAGLTLPV